MTLLVIRQSVSTQTNLLNVLCVKDTLLIIILKTSKCTVEDKTFKFLSTFLLSIPPHPPFPSFPLSLLASCCCEEIPENSNLKARRFILPDDLESFSLSQLIPVL